MSDPAPRTDDSNDSNDSFLQEYLAAHRRQQSLPPIEEPSQNFLQRLRRLSRLGTSTSGTDPVSEDFKVKTPPEGVAVNEPSSIPLEKSIEWIAQCGPPYPDFGPFRLQELLGHGGSAFVFKALDRRSQRLVALKIGRSHLQTDPALQARFEREIALAKQLDHAHIVPVLSHGECAQHVYFAMEYFQGTSLRQWLKAHPRQLKIDECARLVMYLAEAITHANARGVIHRDIKPDNVMVDESRQVDGLPFMPLLADFGIASVLSEASISGSMGAIVGTPKFMAPEQVDHRSKELTSATDVYSLGALLYFLLTGEPPTGSTDDRSAMLRALLGDIPSVRTKAPNIPAPLAAICDACLRHRPSLRCPSAQVLAEDLRRYLEKGQLRWRASQVVVRSLEVRVGLVAVLLIAAIVVFVVTNWWQSRQQLAQIQMELAQQQQLAEQLAAQSVVKDRQLRHDLDANKNLRARWYDSEMAFVSLQLERGISVNKRVVGLQTLLAADSNDPQQQSRPVFANLEWPLLVRRVQPPLQTKWFTSKSPLHFVTAAPSFKLMAVGGADDAVRLITCPDSAESDKKPTPYWSIRCDQREVNGAAFAKRTSTLATVGDDGSFRLWDWKLKSALSRHLVLNDECHHVAFIANETQLACSGRRGAVYVLDAATGERLAELPHVGDLMSLLSLHDGNQLVVAGSGAIQVWDVAQRKVVRELNGHQDRVMAVEVTADEKLLLSAGRDEVICVWDLETGELLQQLKISARPISIAVSSRESLVVIGTAHGTLILLRLLPLPSKDRAIATIPELPEVVQLEAEPSPTTTHQPIYGIRFASDGRSLITAQHDGSSRLVPGLLGDVEILQAPVTGPESIRSVAGTDNPEVAAIVTAQQVALWNVRTESCLWSFKLPAGLLDRSELVKAWVQDDRVLAITNHSEAVIWNRQTGDLLGRWSNTMSPPERSAVMHGVGWAFFNRSANALFVAEPTTGAIQRRWDRSSCQHLCWSPQGQWLVEADESAVQIRSWPKGELQAVINSFLGPIRALEASSDGTTVVVASDRLRWYRWSEGKLDAKAVVSDMTPSDAVRMAFNASGSRTVSSGLDPRFDIWNSQTGTRLYSHPTRGRPRHWTLTRDDRFLLYIDDATGCLRRIVIDDPEP